MRVRPGWAGPHKTANSDESYFLARRLFVLNVHGRNVAHSTFILADSIVLIGGAIPPAPVVQLVLGSLLERVGNTVYL